ncbi:hypothetical protein PENTCL1PPCAC_20186, partial [Pristionchus entomophagus]
EEKELLQNGFFDAIVDGEQKRCCKINRIPMNSVAIVHVVTVHSPSLIFVRIINTIRDRLVVREPATLSPLKDRELEEFYYVLCPIEERTYGRARIIKIEPHPTNDNEKLVQLILIDDGNIVWANSSSLVSMDPDLSPGAKDLAYHPWQTSAVSLAGISPKKTPKNRDRNWEEKVRLRLQKLIDGFEKFKTKATTLHKNHNDYGVASVVSLLGLREKKDEEEEEKKYKINYVKPTLVRP